jgi:hypothetical protein
MDSFGDAMAPPGRVLRLKKEDRDGPLEQGSWEGGVAQVGKGDRINHFLINDIGW